MPSLFGRVFLTFWLACALLLASLAAVTSFTNARPLSHRWLMHALDLYATTAIDAYEQGGVPRLTEYLSEIRGDSKISATLLKADVDLTATPVPPAALRLLIQASEDQRSQYSFKSPWLGIVRQARHGNVYFFVAQVEPVKMFGNFIDPENGIFRIAIALLISTTLCGLLARNMTRPIRSLQRTAMAIAGGDLTARTSPALAGRSDEIAFLAHDFDRMAERVQFLLDQQKLLLQDISHELRSPLARLSISAELVQRGDFSAVARMQSDIKSLEKMISDLLTLARIDASEKLSRRDLVHVGRLVQRIVRDASFEGTTDNKAVVQTGEFDRHVLADAGLLHSCIENIVRNALRHTPHGSVVEVKIIDISKPDSALLAITISDEGTGVPEQALEQIFDPFFRIGAQDTHKPGGAGLGLSISRRIANLYGGNITARNMTGGGLQVQVSLPMPSAVHYDRS